MVRDLECTAVAAASCWQDACQGCMRPIYRAAELSRDGQLAIHGCFACFKTRNFAHLQYQPADAKVCTWHSRAHAAVE